MASPNPADHPLPLSPELNPNSSPSNVPFALPIPVSDSTSSSEDVELLISELRASLSSSQTLLSTQATRLSTLADVETELSQLKDQYAFVSAAKEAVEAQLQEEVKKREVAEENVEMLRGQVEQARRGVMQLQKQEKERKRMSVLSGMSGGAGGAGSLGLGFGDEEVLAGESAQRESKLMKRQSMIGRGHRRTSSQSEPTDIHATISGANISTSPNPQGSGGGTLRPVVGGLRELRLGHTSPSNNAVTSPGISTNNPHQSGYFDDAPAPQINKRILTDSPPKKEKEQDSKAEEELTKLRAELQSTQVQLHESEEARVASETCLKALREFIAASGGVEAGDQSDTEEGLRGMSASTAELLKGIRLPPLPTDRDHDDESEAENKGSTAAAGTEKAKPTGWGFKLWANKPTSVPGATPTSTVVEPPYTPQATLSPSGRSRAGSTTTATTPKISPLPTPNEENTLTPSASTSTITPLSNFVSNWTKNVSPGKPAAQSQPQLQLPVNSRKLSMPSFFSRSSTSGSAGKRGSTQVEKDLPTPPEHEGEIDLTSDTHASEIHGDGELEPSAHIDIDEDEHAGGLPGRVDESKRKSQGTTVTDLEEELGTPQVSLKEVELAESEHAGRGKAKEEREGDKVEEVAL